MKITDLQVGDEYAVRNGGYGSMARMRLVAVEDIEIKRYSPGAYVSRAGKQRAGKQRAARMKRLDGTSYPRPYGWPDPSDKDEVFVPGRDVQKLWATHAEIVRNGKERERERDEADVAISRRIDALAAAAGIEIRRNGTSHTYVVVSLEDLEGLA